MHLVGNTLTVGADPDSGPIEQINSLKYLNDPTSSPPVKAFNELALWFAVAPFANSAYSFGGAPMYKYNGNWTPERYTTISIATDGPSLEDR